jgi:hypothetical protein
MNPTRTRPSGRSHPPDLTLPCGLFLLLLALVSAGVGYRAWLGLNDREPLLAGLPAGGAHQREVPPTRQVRRAVLIIADGLDAELGLALQPLRLLQVAGVLAEAEAAAPTVSRASYVTWLAGLAPVDSGVRTNRYRGPFPLDSLPSRARAGRLRSLGYDEGGALLADLFGPHLTTRLSGPEAWPQALAGIRQSDLSVLALTAADVAGHRHGAASAQYQEAAANIALRIAEVRAALDLTQDLLLVVNDHGHLPGGGHARGMARDEAVGNQPHEVGHPHFRADAAAGGQEVVELQGQQRAVGDLPLAVVSAGGPADADHVVEPRARLQVVESAAAIGGQGCRAARSPRCCLDTLLADHQHSELDQAQRCHGHQGQHQEQLGAQEGPEAPLLVRATCPARAKPQSSRQAATCGDQTCAASNEVADSRTEETPHVGDSRKGFA